MPPLCHFSPNCQPFFSASALADRCQRERAERASRGAAEVVAEWRRLLDEGEVKNRAELARRVGVSRARITRALQHT